MVADVLAKGAVPTAEGRLVSYVVRGSPGGEPLLVAVNAFDAPSGPVQIPVGCDQAPLTTNLAPHEVMVRELAWPAD